MWARALVLACAQLLYDCLQLQLQQQQTRAVHVLSVWCVPKGPGVGVSWAQVPDSCLSRPPLSAFYRPLHSISTTGATTTKRREKAVHLYVSQRNDFQVPIMSVVIRLSYSIGKCINIR